MLGIILGIAYLYHREYTLKMSRLIPWYDRWE